MLRLERAMKTPASSAFSSTFISLQKSYKVFSPDAKTSMRCLNGGSGTVPQEPLPSKPPSWRSETFGIACEEPPRPQDCCHMLGCIEQQHVGLQHHLQMPAHLITRTLTPWWNTMSFASNVYSIWPNWFTIVSQIMLMSCQIKVLVPAYVVHQHNV